MPHPSSITRPASRAIADRDLAALGSRRWPASRSLRIQVAVFERASAYSAVATIAAHDLLAIDRPETELLAELALRAVGHQVQLSDACRPARSVAASTST